MAKTPIIQPTLKELFETKIVHMILSGELSVGDRLPSERELAQIMELSKTVIHEGLKNLERLGFVYVDRNQGTYVGNYMQNGTLETLNYIIRESGEGMDSLTVSSFLELRMIAQLIALTDFVEEYTEEDIEALKGIIEDVKEIASEKNFRFYDRIADRIFDFYQYIFSHCGNNVLPLLMNTFRAAALILWKDSLRADGVAASVKHMENMVGFIQKKDMAAAYLYTYHNFEKFLTHPKCWKHPKDLR